MKKRGLIYLLLLYPFFSICQEYDTVLYKASYSLMNGKKGVAPADSIVVEIGSAISHCYSAWNKKAIDFLQKQYIDNPTANKSSSIDLRKFPKTKYGSSETIFKFFNKKEIVSTDQLLTDKYYYEDSLDLFNWKILSDTATINGFLTQRAETDFRGRHYTTWFSTEIQLDIGPFKFGRLPGIIVQVSDDKGRYMYQLVSFEKATNQKLIIWNPKDWLRTDRSKLFQLRKEMYENPVAFINAQGTGSITINSGNMPRKRKYDPLELE